MNLQGYLIALSDCQANRKKDSDNPGNVRLERLHAYEMVARNATPGTHYQVKVPGAPETDRRWVAMSCGAYAPQSALIGPGPSPGGGNGGSTPAPDSVENQLVASWQPGFCATDDGQRKTECRTLTAERPDATQFSVHGLWPDDLDNKDIFPCYCDLGAPISCGERRPAVDSLDLDPDVLAALKVAMPGEQSKLHLHEWTKHGTCYEDYLSGADATATPDEYYSDTLKLLAQLNASAVRDVFVEHLGQDLSREEIEAAFDASFGAGAGDRVVIRCDRNTGVITELWIGLGGPISDNSDLGSLILAAPTTDISTDATSCASGPVVRVN